MRAILPLYVARGGPLGVARLLGYMDINSPVSLPEDRGLAGAALRAASRRRGACRLVYAESLPAPDWSEAVGGRLLRRTEELVLEIGGRSWDEVLATRRRKSRAALRRNERRLVEEHGLEFRLADDTERLPADVDALFRLHGSRWGGETTGVFEGDLGRFNREFAARGLARGWLRLWFAEVDGEPSAAWLGWRYAGSEWFYQAGRDGRHEDLSVGMVLLAHTIREACADEIGVYRFMAGADSYKLHWANAEYGVETRLVGPGPVTALAAAGFAAARSRPLARLQAAREARNV